MKIMSYFSTLFVLTALVGSVHAAKKTATTTSSQTYSAGAVLPTDVYCPEGQVCDIPAPTFIINVSDVQGQQTRLRRN